MSSQDITLLIGEVLKFKALQRVPDLKLLLSRCFSKFKVHVQQQEEFYEEFESRLDVWNLVQNQMSYQRFTDAFLSHE